MKSFWENWGWNSFAGKYFRIWQSDMDGNNTSEALFDPYTFAHAFMASLQFFLIPPVQYHNSLWIHPFVLNFILHLLFEFFENTPIVIVWCRRITPDKKYIGDSVLNTIGDMITFTVFYGLTWVLWETINLWSLVLPAYTFSILVGFYLNYYYNNTNPKTTVE